MEIKLKENERYRALAVQFPEGISIAIAPRDSSIYQGDCVKVSGGRHGVVLLVDDYVSTTELIDVQKNAIGDIATVTEHYRKYDVDWED